MTVYDSHPDGAYGAYPGADATYAGAGDVPTSGMTTWLGGLASLALMGGLALWSYDLVLRDVAGVPVIRALDGPMRVQPDNPGGSQADYQGLAVNQVQAEGVAAAAPAQIMLAPRPLDLSDATPPSTQLAELPAGAQTEAQVMQAVYAPQTPEPVDTGLAVEALLNEIVAGEDAVGDIVPTSVPGVARSPRPPSRPEGVQLASLSTTPVAAEATRGFVDPSTLTPGARMVQFRAYQSAAEAEQAWETINAQFGDFMDGKSPVILPSSDGTKSFYRLRMTGFEDMAEAQRFCSVFLAADRDCVPVQF